MRIRLLILILLVSAGSDASVYSQSQVAAEPIVGLRDNRPKDYALVGARVVTRPGRVIENATVLIQNTSVTAVGAEVDVPAGFMQMPCAGRTIYAGLIDAYSEVVVPSETKAAYWNQSIRPERSAHSVAAQSLDDAKKLRSQGFTARLIAPQGGIVKGSSAVVLLSDESAGRRLLKPTAWQHLQLTVPRHGPRDKYPNSPMGAVALLRQSMFDAMWYRDAWQTYRAQPDLPRPETNLALETLAAAMEQSVFVIDSPNERMALRADAISEEFSLQAILRGSGREYRELDALSEAGHPILVPVDFPEAPDVKTAADARNTTLQELMHWDLAPENPALLSAAKIKFCLTTDGLKNPGDFLKQARVAVDRGLDSDAALAALTTTPAELLGIDTNTGRIQPGMLANLVITDGDLFSSKTKVLETWVAGEQFVVSVPRRVPDGLAGRWQLTIHANQSKVAIDLQLEQKDDKLTGSLTSPKKQKQEEESSTKLVNMIQQRDRLSATVDLGELSDDLPKGKSLLSVVTVTTSDEGKPDVFAALLLPDGQSVPVAIAPLPDEPANEEEDRDEQKDPASQESSDTDQDSTPAASQHAKTPRLYPLGANGLESPLTETTTVMFRGATVWTCEKAGILAEADVLIHDGKIADVGKQLAVPKDCQIVDARGKHITPGLIDCHSHMGTDGGVNESGQAVTAEVRIGDFIDNSDMNIYRQLAGGLTTSNILHGSANPIGGQNQVIKLRWGASMDELRMQEAPAGIKFALGENVKRSRSRYPNTRMGVEQIIRDQLLAAREYDALWRRWQAGQRSTLPPRVDLQLEALAEIQRGKRWIHCHSYRQDEIVATLEVLEEFGIQIGTLQHILEGYKVADRMAQHGAMASAFSDWWAYKFEVFDAVPYNGALMHQQGVVVSFNSDDRELGRRLNTEAAKATKYGGVAPEEALKFVTLNPAKQLRIDQYVGSLAIGKHADLIVWSGPPLSTTTRCEQTWIDGIRYFDLESDRRRRTRDAALHAQLIQKALGADGKTAKHDNQVEEEDRWVRHDAFCGCHSSKQGGRQ